VDPGTTDAAAGGPEYPDHLCLLVEGYLEGLDFGAAARVARLAEAMRYSLLAGGKRIRPVLTLAVAEGLGRAPEQVLPTAAALELIHTYSLIHDDLPAIDNDELRRGKPTCHVVYGEDIAILAGDGLFAEAFHLLVARQQASPAVMLAVVAEVARATGLHGMVGGQYIDVTAVPDGGDDLRVLHALKTGRLIEAAVVVGALLCGVRSAARQARYRAFAAEIGLLFQIVDDMLDVEGSPETMGKSAGKDEALAKLTYVSKYGMAKTRALAAESHARATARLQELGGDTQSLAAVADYIYRRER
jgi:geranylgeranyl diphosphate synthase, type II